MLSIPNNNIVCVGKADKDHLYAAIRNIAMVEDQALRNTHFQDEIVKSARFLSNGIFDDLIAVLKTKLEETPYFVVVRGLDIGQNLNLVIPILCGIGKLIEPYNKPWSKVLHPLRPSTDWKGGATDTLSESLHTDGTSWIHPNDYSSLVCINHDQSGGVRSRLVDIDTLFEDFIGFAGVETFENCCGVNIPWKTAPELGGGIHWAPIFQKAEIRWMEYTIRQAIETERIILTDEMQFVLRNAIGFLENYDNLFDFMLEPGDCLIFDNKRTLHARTPITNPGSSERFYYRIKIDKA